MPIQIDNTVRNSDWLRSETWDIKPPTLSRLFEVLRVKDGSTIAKRDALVNFLLLPAAEPMPTGLKNLVRLFLNNTKNPQPVGSDVTEKTITPVQLEEIVVSFELPEDIENQLPIIPDGVIIEAPDDLEKILGFLRRVIQVFRGKPGNWITRKGGGKFFIERKGQAANDFLEKTLGSDAIVSKAPVNSVFTDPSFNATDVNIINFVTFKSGIRGVHRMGTKGRQEWRSYEATKALGWDDLIPPVSLRKAERQLPAGSIQFLNSGRKPGLINKMFESKTFVRQTNNNDLGRATTFDYISGNIDRHDGNYMFANKRLKLIDHEGAFMSPKFPKARKDTEFTLFEVLRRTGTEGSYARGFLHSDLFFEAGRRKLPIKTFMKDVNGVDWNALFKRLDIPKDVAKTTRERIRILNEAADANWDWSQLRGTPISPTGKHNISNLPRVSDQF